MIETARGLSSCVAPRIESPRSARSPCPSGVFPNRPSPPKPFPPSRETPSPFSPSELASLRLWTAGRIAALSRARSAPASPLRTSPGTRGSELAPLPTSPPNKPAAGSGLLGESQLSLRTECACQPSDHALSDQAPPQALECGSLLPLSRSHQTNPISFLKMG